MAGCASHTTEGSKTNEKVGEAFQDLVTNCKYLDQSQYPALPVPVDFDRELVIRDLHVVEDPCRTTWTPTVACAAGTVGVWTFGHLMSEMAGSTPPEQFVAEWVHTFEIDQSVNTFPVPARSNVRGALIDSWLEASGCKAGDPIVGDGACKLDLKKAPFRLLAIVNRADLSGPAYGAENPGEARFVFGMLHLTNGGDPKGGGFDPKKAAEAAAALELADAEVKPGDYDPAPPVGGEGQLQGEALAATTILEYRIPPGPKLVDWVSQWHALSSIPIDKPDFNVHLQQITDAFTLAGVNPERPNKGSSIGQVRTNEIALGDGWELREFTLQDAERGFDGFALKNDTTKQTPDDSMNNSGVLDTWMLANEPDIMNVDHVVPLDFMDKPLLGGVSHENFAIWEPGVVPPMDPLARHHFALTACNGCHTNATSTGFTHIGPRSIGSVAALSSFLGAPPIADPSNNGLPDASTVLAVPDELTGAGREYQEPWRRVCEENRILVGDPDPYTRGNGGVH